VRAVTITMSLVALNVIHTPALTSRQCCPAHARNVRRHMIDLFTPAELDTLAGLNERILRRLAGEPHPQEAAPEPPRARAD
jgi:hypothetical protein